MASLNIITPTAFKSFRQKTTIILAGGDEAYKDLVFIFNSNLLHFDFKGVKDGEKFVNCWKL